MGLPKSTQPRTTNRPAFGYPLGKGGQPLAYNVEPLGLLWKPSPRLVRSTWWVKALPVVGLLGLEPPLYRSEKTPLSTQDDAESDASSTGLDTLIESWGLLTADDRRRIIAILNGRLA